MSPHADEVTSTEAKTLTLAEGEDDGGVADTLTLAPALVPNTTKVDEALFTNLEIVVPKNDEDTTLPVIVANDNNWVTGPNGSPEMILNYNGRVVPAEKKQTEGGWALLNFDNDSGVGDFSHGHTEAKSDLDYVGPIAAEKDLLQLKVKQLNSSETVGYRLKFDATNIRIWKQPDRSDPVTSEQTVFGVAAGKTYAVLYVEGIKSHDDDTGTMITEQIKVGATGSWADGDKVKIRVAQPIVVLLGDGEEWTTQDGKPITDYIQQNAPQKDGKVDPLYQRTFMGEANTYLVSGFNQDQKKVCYSFSGAIGEKANKLAKLALKTEGTNIIFDGHSNWGIGIAFQTGLTEYNQFFWTAANGQPAVSLEGFSQHPNLTIGNGGRNLNAAGKLNSLRKTQIQNRYLAGIPLNNIERYPNLEVPKIAVGSNFLDKTLPIPTLNPSDVMHYHYKADPDYDGDIQLHPGEEDKRVIIQRPGDTDVPTDLKYRSLLFSQCNSFRYYIESFKHGVLIGTWGEIGDEQIARTYVESIVRGKSWADTKTALDKTEPDANRENKRGTFQVTTF